LQSLGGDLVSKVITWETDMERSELKKLDSVMNVEEYYQINILNVFVMLENLGSLNISEKIVRIHIKI
jgi:hypothetical protein